MDENSHAVINFIRQIVHALEIGSRAAQRNVGLSGAQLFILQTLASGGAMSVNELAAYSHTHQSSVSVVVSRLVQTGLVTRTASTIDARRVELTVTQAGRRTLKCGFITPQERLIASLRHLTPARLAQFRSVLEEVVTLSGMDSGTAPMFFEGTKLRKEKSRSAAGKSGLKGESK